MAGYRAFLRRQVQRWRVHSDFWRSLPGRSLFELLVAVFFMFSTTGLVGHIQSIVATSRSHWLGALTSAALAGVSAAAFVLAFVRDKRYLVLVVAFQIGWMWVLTRRGVVPSSAPLSPGEAEAAIVLYANLCIFTLLLGYIFFIDFITRSGVQHMRLRTEMALAEQTHRLLVPPLSRRTPRFEAYGQSRASSQVGGDLLDDAESKDGTLLVVADVSGHGVAAGTLLSLTKGAIQAQTLGDTSLGAIVAGLNRVLYKVTAPNMFVTFAGIRLGPAGEAEVCLAGHLPILHFDAEGARVARVPNRSVPLGILADAEFPVERLRVRSGDVLTVLTDGLTEVENDDGKEFGIEGVESLVGSQLDRPLPEIHASVMDAVQRHGPQQDDQTLLLLRVL